MGKKGSKLSKEDIKELEGCTYFEGPQLQKWYKDFIRDCPTGFMSKVEFANIYGQFFPSGNPGGFVDYVFNVFDVNKDGVITFKEFIRAISVASRGSVEEKLNWAFNLYDLDNDGYVTQLEMLDIVRSIYALHGKTTNLPQRLKNTHKSQSVDSGSLNGDALPTIDSPEKRVNQLFAKLDKNQDGKLSREEFCKGFKNDPWIAKALLGDMPSTNDNEEKTNGKSCGVDSPARGSTKHQYSHDE